MEQESLFDQPLSDPAAPAAAMHSNPRDTEAEAARLILPRSGTDRLTCLEAFRAHPEGLTDEELAKACGLYLYTAAPRRVELTKGGWVVDSGIRRQTDRGRQAIVWRLSTEALEALAS